MSQQSFVRRLIQALSRSEKTKQLCRLRFDTLEDRTVPATSTINYQFLDDITGDGLTPDDPLLLVDHVVDIITSSVTFQHHFVDTPEAGLVYTDSDRTYTGYQVTSGGNEGTVTSTFGVGTGTAIDSGFNYYQADIVDSYIEQSYIPLPDLGILTGEQYDIIVPNNWPLFDDPLFGDELVAYADFPLGSFDSNPISNYTAAYFRPATISGTVFEDRNANGVQDVDEPGIAGVPIDLDTVGNDGLPDGSYPTVTQADGSYLIENVGPFPNGVQVVLDYSQDYATARSSLNSFVPLSGSNRSVDLGVFKAVAVSGKLYNDLNGNGHQEGNEPDLGNAYVIVDTNGDRQLTASDGPSILFPEAPYSDHATSLSDGTFSLRQAGPGVVRANYFGGVLAQQVTVTEGHDGYVLQSGQDLTNIKFGLFYNQTVYGQVFHDTNSDGQYDHEPFVANAKVELLQAGRPTLQATTDASGLYLFPSAAAPGPFQVRQVLDAVSTQTAPTDPNGYFLASNQSEQALPVPLFGRSIGTDLLLTGAVRADSEQVIVTYQSLGIEKDYAIGVYRSADNQFGPSDIPVATPRAIHVAGGGAVGTLAIDLPAGFKHNPKLPYLFVVVDPNKKVKEVDETNNNLRVTRIIETPFQFQGNFEYEAEGDRFVSSGPVKIGFKPQEGETYTALVQINGTVAYDEKTITITGDVTAIVELAHPYPLFTGTWLIDSKTGATTSLSTRRDQSLFDLVGRPFEFFRVSLGTFSGQPVVEVQGRLALPFPASGIALNITGTNMLRIGAFGLNVAGSIAVPDVDFELPNGVQMEATNLSGEFTGAPDYAFRFRGKVMLKKLPANISVEADISGEENYLQYGANGWNVIGSLTVEDFPLGFGVMKKMKVTYNSITGDWRGDAEFHPEFLEGENTFLVGLGRRLGAWDYLSVGFDHLNILLPPSPVFLQKLQGQFDHVSEGNPDTLEYGGSIGLTYLPEFESKFDEFGDLPWLPFFSDEPETFALARLDVSGKWSRRRMDGAVELKFLHEKFLSLSGELDYRRAIRNPLLNIDMTTTATAKGAVNFLDGVVTGTGQLVLTADAHIKAVGTLLGTVKLPKIKGTPFRGQELGSGNAYAQAIDDANTANDYAIAYGTVSTPLGAKVLGFKYGFDGSFKVLNGMGEILPFLGSRNSDQLYEIAPGTSELLLTADWDNDVGSVVVEIEAPDGTVYTSDNLNPDEMAIVDAFSTPTRTSIGIKNPAPGLWTIRIPNSDALGDVRFEAARDTVAPTVSFTSSTTTPGEITLNYSTADSDSNARVTLLYGTDPTSAAGTPFAEFDEADSNGQYVWDTSEIPEGKYYIWAMVDDGDNAPVFSLLSQQVSVDHSSPTVNQLSTHTTPQGIDTLTVQFSEAMSGVDVAGNYALRDLGKDGKFGTKDDVVLPFAVAYNPATNEATLTLNDPKNPTQAKAAFTNKTYLLTLTNLTDEGGLALAGDTRLAFGTGNKFTYRDTDGDLFTATLSGPGLLNVRVADPDGDGQGQLTGITVANTDAAKSRLTLAVAKAKTGDGIVTIGTITGSGLKGIAAAKSDLAGEVNLTGPLGGLTLRDLKANSSVTALGDPTVKTPIRVHDVANGATINLGSKISTFTAARVGAATITAPSLDVLTVKGDKKAGLLADFGATVTLSGVGVSAEQLVLKKATIGGTVNGATIQVAGNVGTFTTKAFINSRLSVGFTADEFNPMTGTFTLPATLGSFNVTGIPKATAPAFAGSVVAAANLKQAKLLSVDEVVETSFYGFVSDTLGTLLVTTPKFRHDPSNSEPQELGDFRVIVL